MTRFYRVIHAKLTFTKVREQLTNIDSSHQNYCGYAFQGYNSNYQNYHGVHNQQPFLKLFLVAEKKKKDNTATRHNSNKFS